MNQPNINKVNRIFKYIKKDNFLTITYEKKRMSWNLQIMNKSHR